MNAPLTVEQIAAIQRDAALQLKILKGERFEELRAVSRWTLQALDDRASLIEALKPVLESDAHVGYCAETRFGFGHGYCDCEIKTLRELMSRIGDAR